MSIAAFVCFLRDGVKDSRTISGLFAVYQLHLDISDIGENMSFALSMALSLTLFANFVIFFYYNEKVRKMVKNIGDKKCFIQKWW